MEKPSLAKSPRYGWGCKRCGLLALVLALAIPAVVEIARVAYDGHGHGDQLAVLVIVVASFVSPVLAPIIHLKLLLLNDFLPLWVETEIVRAAGRYIFTPIGDFEDYDQGPSTDYSDDDNWSMLPGRGDTSDLVPPGVQTCNDAQLCGAADVFYLHPTTWYTSASWNAPVRHPVTVYLSDDAIGPQQANTFNIVGRVFAPRYRQMSAGSFLQEDGFANLNANKSLHVAFEDVSNAFRYYLEHHWDGKRGIIITGHSQGSLLGEKLILEFFEGKPLQDFLIAAYLPGWSIFREKYDKNPDRYHGVRVCDHPEMLGCVISWRTFAKGGDPTAFLHVEAPSTTDRPICVNPLNWKDEGGYAGFEENKGGLDLMHPWTMWLYITGVRTSVNRIALPELSPSISDAECEMGALYITPPRRFGAGWYVWPAWHFATFPGLNHHPYDLNFFYANVRDNVAQRTRAFMLKSAMTSAQEKGVDAIEE